MIGYGDKFSLIRMYKFWCRVVSRSVPIVQVRFLYSVIEIISRYAI